MVKLAVTAVALVFAVRALAGEGAPVRTVDLRASHALEQLQKSNPAHYEKIQQVVAGLKEEPKRAEGSALTPHPGRFSRSGP